MSDVHLGTRPVDTEPLWRQISAAEYDAKQAARPLSRAIAHGVAIDGLAPNDEGGVSGVWEDEKGVTYDVTFLQRSIGLYALEDVRFVEQRPAPGNAVKHGVSLTINEYGNPPIFAHTDVDPETDKLWRVPEADQVHIWRSFQAACADLGKEVLSFAEIDNEVLVYAAGIAQPVHQMPRHVS